MVSWTYLPGLQFILAGLVGNTAAFFAVPAMRLALDVMVYMGIMALFVVKVVVIKDAGVLTPWEFLWLIYVVGAVWQQVSLRQIYEGVEASRSLEACLSRHCHISRYPRAYRSRFLRSLNGKL